MFQSQTPTHSPGAFTSSLDFYFYLLPVFFYIPQQEIQALQRSHITTEMSLSERNTLSYHIKKTQPNQKPFPTPSKPLVRDHSSPIAHKRHSLSCSLCHTRVTSRLGPQRPSKIQPQFQAQLTSLLPQHHWLCSCPPKSKRATLAQGCSKTPEVTVIQEP